MSYALAEMAVFPPLARSFGGYAEKYLHSLAGFTGRATFCVAPKFAHITEVVEWADLYSLWVSLTITLRRYMGVEIIAVTAGEAEHPEVTIPHAMRSIVWRLILFYVAAIAIMVAMVPWNQSGNSSTLSGSPFVTVFVAAHIPFAAAIMNFVVLTAALSSVNTNLYLSTRMLFSLGRGGYGPD